MLSAFYLTFRRANLSLMGCTSAEPISVSVRSKVQRIKLYLQTVEIPNHFQFRFTFLNCIYTHYLSSTIYGYSDYSIPA